MSEGTNVAQVPAPQDELIVALEHANLVEAVLRDAGWGPRTERSEPLGLALISLSPDQRPAALETGLARRLAALERRDDEASSQNEASIANARIRIDTQVRKWGEPQSALDRALQSLRAFFTLRYDGWVPTMGKNRFVGGAIGPGGSISHGGGPDPERIDHLPNARGTRGSGVVVGVLDTGIVGHPWFMGSVLAPQADVLAEPVHGDFSAGHATFVAGLVLQQAPGATVRCHRVLGDTGTATSWDVAKAIVELGRTGVDVLNLSLVCYTQDKQAPLALATAVDRLSRETLVVACAGNHGDPKLTVSEVHRREPAWPAALDDVVAVGSWSRGAQGPVVSDLTPKRAPWIDILAEGEGVKSSYITGKVRHVCAVCGDSDEEAFDGYASWSGTSFSAARVSGHLAAVMGDKGVSPREAYGLMTEGLKRDDPDLAPFVDLPRPASWPAAPPAAGDGRS